jgi:hypothetical protein
VSVKMGFVSNEMEDCWWLQVVTQGN